MLIMIISASKYEQNMNLLANRFVVLTSIIFFSKVECEFKETTNHLNSFKKVSFF